MVDPSVLESTSQKINEQANDYEQQYNKLFSEVDGMAQAWTGVDNQAFVSQIKGFMDDFQKMTALMRQYADFLKNSASTYRQTQSDIISKAKTLAN
jgi:WXG100 family type VII secretion target